MSEIDQLKERINNSKNKGIETAHIRDDYDPIGQVMINDLCSSNEYVQRKVPMHSFNAKWKIFKKEYSPY